MEREKLIKQALKRKLLSEVAWLYEQDHRRWKEPIVQTLRELREAGVAAVFFGGTLRSLLFSRLMKNKPGRPRDVDIVIEGATVEALKDRFRTLIMRETRFGGLKLQRMNWQFDVWPLDRTWGFLHDSTDAPSFALLPRTTFFNLEAIAVDVWARRGKTRNIYSGDDQFFEGILTRTLELNRPENPFPGLCIIRSLVMAASLDYAVGPRLAAYLSENASTLRGRDFDTIQREHYGMLRYEVDSLRRWLDHVIEAHARSPGERHRLPICRQQTLWPEEDDDSVLFHLRILENLQRHRPVHETGGPGRPPAGGRLGKVSASPMP